MPRKSWTLAGILLAAMTTAVPAAADDAKFTTKGYYVETVVTSAFDVAVVIWGGPYKTRAACKTALQALVQDQPHASCHFEKRDPNADP
jgi:hypothetical protein